MGMDRKLAKNRRPLMIKLGLVAVFGSSLAYAGLRMLQDSSVATFRVEKERVTLGTVDQGTFEDFIPVRGTVTPLKSVFLDAVEGGRVEKIFVESGSIVEAGQPLIELSNTALQLDVISREAQVSEQLNNLRNTRLAMEQNRLSLKSQLVDMDYQIIRLERLVERREKLADQKLISQADYLDAKDELQYYRNRRAVTIESQQQDETMRQSQIESLETGVDQLQRNLEIARKNLDSLIITAPISGQLSSLDAELGQSKARGETLGQIDDTERFKLSVLIDEFYVTRTRAGQYAEFTLSDKSYELRIAKVYPQILNGQFEVDMEFAGATPPDIRRGQTLQTRVQLGDASEALLLPRGGFFQDTGGNWAFVLDATGQFAVKRDIRLGRRNPEYFEVLEGLEQGEQIITSEYAAYATMERIQFD
ncbi:MAG: HlyD family efflux transporter periplasmic adaptor subunit [Pseudomonadota bacterium]